MCENKWKLVIGKLLDNLLYIVLIQQAAPWVKLHWRYEAVCRCGVISGSRLSNKDKQAGKSQRCCLAKWCFQGISCVLQGPTQGICSFRIYKVRRISFSGYILSIQRLEMVQASPEHERQAMPALLFRGVYKTHPVRQNVKQWKKSRREA